ncbi:MAG: FixH family protein [Phycisphaerales bacterium]
MIKTAKGESLRRAGSGKRWPLMIVGLLGLNATVVVVTIVCATSDRSFAIEPDYYKKAVEWDRAARERDHAAELGWDVQAALVPPAAAAARPVLRVTLNRPAPAGASAAAPTPLDGAQVQVEAFPQARSSQRFSGSAVGVGNGVYEIEAPMTRAGLWEVRIRINRGPDALAVLRTLTVAAEPAGRSNP